MGNLSEIVLADAVCNQSLEKSFGDAPNAARSMSKCTKNVQFVVTPVVPALHPELFRDLVEQVTPPDSSGQGDFPLGPATCL